MNYFERKRISIGLVTVCLFCLGALSAQNAGRSLSLQEAKQIALENNTAIKNAKLDVSIAKKKVIETTAIGLPQVSATANYQHIFKVPTLPPALGGAKLSPADNTVFKLQVSQLIFSGEYIVGLQATRVYKLISEQSLTKSRIETESMVESTYYLALTLAENLKIIQLNRALTAQTLKEMTAMNKAGFNEQSDLDQLQINMNLLGNLESSIEGQLINVNNQLKYQLGMELADNLMLTDKLEDVISTISPFDGHEFNIKQNVDFQMAVNNVSAQKLSLRREQSGYLPTLSAFYQHQEKQKVPVFDFEPKDVLGVTLSVPIFTSGSRWMKVKQAKLAFDKAQNSQIDAEKGLQLKYDKQRLDYQTAYNTFLNQKESSELSQRIFKNTTEKFKQGVSSSLELTQTQGQYLEAVSNYYNSLLSLLNARVELQKLTTPSN